MTMKGFLLWQRSKLYMNSWRRCCWSSPFLGQRSFSFLFLLRRNQERSLYLTPPPRNSSRVLSPSSFLHRPFPAIFPVRFITSKKKKKKNKQQSTTSPSATEASAKEAHTEWVEFQKSIAVEGFETGQTLTVQSTGRSGGRVATRQRLTKREEMAKQIQERQRLAGAGGGQFPPMRYSDEETERLLKMAYAAIPPRAGRRGTRNLKRQKLRWHLVRRIHRKYKEHIRNFHVRRMQKRSQKIRQVRELIATAPDIVAKDQEYQQHIYQQYQQRLGLAAVN